MLSRRIQTLDARETRRSEEDHELEILSASQTALYRPLTLLPFKQREWLSLWELCRSQRYGQGMTVGTLVHSEIWNNLEQLGYGGHEKERAFHIILGVDEIYREYAEKTQEGKA